MERTDEASKDVRRGGEELKGAIAVTELGDRMTDENDRRLLQKDLESQDKMEQQAPEPWRWLVIGRKKLPGRREAHWGYVERVTNDEKYLRSFLAEGESSVMEVKERKGCLRCQPHANAFVKDKQKSDGSLVLRA